MTTIYVDLVKDEPASLAKFDSEYPVGASDSEVDEAYKEYRSRFQPYRLLIKSGDNQEPLFRSTERYFNRSDAIHAAELAFGESSNVYLREKERGNRVLRLATDGPQK